ncbi:hypothetical protein ACEYYA_11010 [Paracoccus sp. p3-h83]|uniref:hypothetical protein n=1 Tax=Paracoccus sp. p3-h83 TaxID=3342805 RepID=UPI0035B82E65
MTKIGTLFAEWVSLIHRLQHEGAEGNPAYERLCAVEAEALGAEPEKMADLAALIVIASPEAFPGTGNPPSAEMPEVTVTRIAHRILGLPSWPAL